MKNRTLIQSELWMIKWLKLYTVIAMKPLPPKSILTFLWRVLPHVGPYQSQDVLNSNEQWFHDGKQKPSQTMTETKPSREKRQVTTLALLCSSRLVKTNSPSSLPCVQRILYCPAYNLSEFQCKERPLSFSCLESITRTDYTLCIAKSTEVVIYKGTRNEKRVMITTGCFCALNSILNLKWININKINK